MNALALQDVQAAVAVRQAVPVKQRVPTQEDISEARARLKLPKHPKKVSDRLKADIRAAMNSDIDWGDC